MNGWSIGKKLYLGVASMLALLVIGEVVAMGALSRMQANMNQATGVIMHRLRLAAVVADAAQEGWTGEKGTLVSIFIKDQKNVDSYRDQEAAALQTLAGTLAELKPLLLNEADKQDAAKIESDLASWRLGLRQVYNLSDRGQPVKAAEQSRESTKPIYKNIVALSTAMRTRFVDELTRQSEEGDNAAASARWLMMGIVVASLFVGLVTAWSVRGIVNALGGTVTELNSGGRHLATASLQIATTSESLSRGSSEQAASLEQVSATMEEMTAMTRRNAENSKEATAMMTETVMQVDRSNNALSEMVASMQAIKVSSEKVARINRTIDEIAFQTNILALNAAVEAARAGEAGMGFAVVADEVRNLAQRSAVAARDTAALIEEAIANSNQGAAKLEQVAAAIRGITDSANKVKGLVDEVNEASRQQTIGIDEVTKAILQVGQVTQASAASAEETAAAAEELSAQSQEVSDLVRQLRNMVDGVKDRASFHPRTIAPAPAAKLTRGQREASADSLPSGSKSKEEVFPMATTGSSFRNF